MTHVPLVMQPVCTLGQEVRHALDPGIRHKPRSRDGASFRGLRGIPIQGDVASAPGVAVQLRVSPPD